MPRSRSTAPTSGSDSSTRPSPRLWGIEDDWLAGEPSLDELLERLRERRRIPEFADFRAFKRQQLGDVHLADRAAAGADAPARRPHPERLGVAASVRRPDLRLRGRDRPAGARTLVQHADRGAARDARQSVRGHRRVRQRRPAQTAQPGLSQDLGAVGGRSRRRAAYRRDRREDPRLLRRRRRLAGAARRGSSPAITGQAPIGAASSTAATARCCSWRRCRCPTATCC